MVHFFAVSYLTVLRIPKTTLDGLLVIIGPDMRFSPHFRWVNEKSVFPKLCGKKAMFYHRPGIELWEQGILMMNRSQHSTRGKHGFSLLEILAILTILSIIAVVVVPRISVSWSEARQQADLRTKGAIDLAVERWYFEKGTWPADDLSDIAANPYYFPQGLPINPSSGKPYTLNSTTHRVN